MNVYEVSTGEALQLCSQAAMSGLAHIKSEEIQAGGTEYCWQLRFHKQAVFK